MAEQYFTEIAGRKEGPLCKADLIRWRRNKILEEGAAVTDAEGRPVDLAKLLGSPKSQGSTLAAFQRSFYFYRKETSDKKKWPRVLATLFLIFAVLIGLGASLTSREPVDLSAMSFAQIEDHYKNRGASYSVETKGRNETEKFVYGFDKGKRTFMVFNGRVGLMTLDFDEPCSEEEAKAALDIPGEGEPKRKVTPGAAGKKDIIEYPDYNPRVEYVKLYAKDGRVYGVLVKFVVNWEDK